MMAEVSWSPCGQGAWAAAVTWSEQLDGKSESESEADSVTLEFEGIIPKSPEGREIPNQPFETALVSALCLTTN